MRRLVGGLATFLVLLAGACSRSPQHYLDLGNRLAAQNKYTDAALNYRKAIQKNASFGEAYYQLGLTELKLGKPQDALALLLGAVKLMPARDDVKVKLADLCLSLFIADRRHPQVLFDRTAIVSDQLLLTNPHSFDGLRLKAQLSAISNRFEEAEQLYSQANQVKPMQPEVILGWTEALLQRKQMKQVETLARQLIGANKTYLPIYIVLYRCYVSAGQLGEAEEVLQTKIANNPNDVTSRLELAAVYGESSREAQLRASRARVVDDPKGFPLARLQVGDLYSRMQRWND